MLGRVPRRTGQKLLRFDRRLDVRLVAGADEAGRGSLAGPLVVAGVLLDYGCLRDAYSGRIEDRTAEGSDGGILR